MGYVFKFFAFLSVLVVCVMASTYLSVVVLEKYDVSRMQWKDEDAEVEVLRRLIEKTTDGCAANVERVQADVVRIFDVLETIAYQIHALSGRRGSPFTEETASPTTFLDTVSKTIRRRTDPPTLSSSSPVVETTTASPTSSPTTSPTTSSSSPTATTSPTIPATKSPTKKFVETKSPTNATSSPTTTPPPTKKKSRRR